MKHESEQFQSKFVIELEVFTKEIVEVRINSNLLTMMPGPQIWNCYKTCKFS